jgi:hypothetical protein
MFETDLTIGFCYVALVQTERRTLLPRISPLLSDVSSGPFLVMARVLLMQERGLAAVEICLPAVA